MVAPPTQILQFGSTRGSARQAAQRKKSFSDDDGEQPSRTTSSNSNSNSNNTASNSNTASSNTRYDSSLGLLTRKFTNLIQVSYYGYSRIRDCYYRIHCIILLIYSHTTHTHTPMYTHMYLFYSFIPSGIHQRRH